jgi:CheY-like chemotaxis protein
MKTILVVDDVNTDRELLGKVVSSAGFNPVFVNDGSEALAAAKQHTPTLIFMDVVMPNKDGFATCRAIRNDPDTKNIPVVLVTTKTTESDKFWGTKQGATDHVGKPFSPASIVSMIQRYAR